MGPFSRARWARSQSAPPCPGAWSYRILGRFPLPEGRVERQQQRRQAPQPPVTVPQAGRPKPIDGTVQPHPPGCCIHPQYQPSNFPPAAPPVPVDAVNNANKARATTSRHYIPANANYPTQSPYHQPCYPPQNPVRDPAHVHPTPPNGYPQPQPLHPQGHSHSGYFPPPPPPQHFPPPQPTPNGNPQRPGIVHSHSYPDCQHPHPHNHREYPNPHDPRVDQHPHQYTHGLPASYAPQAPRPAWNAVNSKGPGSTSAASPSHPQPTTIPLEGQGTFQRPFIIHTPSEGPNLTRPSSERPYSHYSPVNTAAGTGSQALRKRQAEEPHILPPPSANPSSAQNQPTLQPNVEPRPPYAGSAPKRTRKSYTREYKLKALNLLKSERPDGKGGMMPASDTWVSRQVGVTRKVLRGWKAQEDRLRASRKGSRRVRIGRNRERRKIQDGGKERGDKGKGKEIETIGTLAATSVGENHGIGSSMPKSPEGNGTASEDEDTEPDIREEGRSSEDEDEGGNQDFHHTPETAVMEP